MSSILCHLSPFFLLSLSLSLSLSQPAILSRASRTEGDAILGSALHNASSISANKNGFTCCFGHQITAVGFVLLDYIIYESIIYTRDCPFGHQSDRFPFVKSARQLQLVEVAWLRIRLDRRPCDIKTRKTNRDWNVG